MTYEVRILPGALRALRRLSPQDKRRVQAVIELLASNPRPPAALKLTARPEWRVRAGDHRVTYRIEDEVLLVLVITIGHRSNVYRRGSAALQRGSGLPSSGERLH